MVAFYVGQLIVAQQALLSPDQIVLGGCVMGTGGLLGRVRRAAVDLAIGCFGIDKAGYQVLVRSPGLGSRSGILGALILAEHALSE